MAVRIGRIHGVGIAMMSVQQAFERLWPEALCTNLLDGSLSPDRESDEVPTDSMCERIRILVDYVTGTGVAGILVTCSAFGEAIGAAAATAPIPVLKPNEAMFEAAINSGTRIGMPATFAPAVASTEREFAVMAAQRQSPARMETYCVPEAMAALRAGDGDIHNRLLADAPCVCETMT